MINHMDQVYANASMTIIAAAGENVQTGLPGVSILPRQPQQRVDVQNTTLLEVPYSKDDLHSSKWASRGWTYQEGQFSKRRLVFTPKEVLFVCGHEYMDECVYLRRPDESPSGFIRRDDESDGMFPTYSSLGLGFSTKRLLEQVEQYSLRELSYTSDSFNAFRGILNYHMKILINEQLPTIHLGWGLLAVLAGRKGTLYVHLDWRHRKPAKRRQEFPSWAWTGWGGPLTFGEGIIVLKKGVKILSGLSHLAWEVSMKAEGKKSLEMCDFVRICLAKARGASGQPYSRSLEPSPRQLLISCRMIPIQFRKVELTYAQRSQLTKIEFEDAEEAASVVSRPAPGNMSLAILEVWKGIYVGVPYELDQDLKQKDIVRGLLFLSKAHYDYRGTSPGKIGCFVTRSMGKGLYERVGLIHYVFPYPRDPARVPMVFLDETGSVLDKVKVPKRMKEQLFEEVSERKTICLT